MHGAHEKHYEKIRLPTGEASPKSKQASSTYEQCDAAEVCRNVQARRYKDVQTTPTSNSTCSGPRKYPYKGQRSTSATVCGPKRNKSGTAGNLTFLNTGISDWKTADSRNTCEQEATDDPPYVLRGILFNGNINSGIPSYKTIQQSHISSCDRPPRHRFLLVSLCL